MKQGTAQSHDRLDRAMAALRLKDPADYALFLQVQLAARAPIERWLAHGCEDALRPPASAPLIQADLAALGVDGALPESMFDPPQGAHPLGIAWAIGGSHFGNRALLARLPGRGESLPTGFLLQPDMAAFWKRLRPRIEVAAANAPASAALAAAEAVFACFARAIRSCEGRLAA